MNRAKLKFVCYKIECNFLNNITFCLVFSKSTSTAKFLFFLKTHKDNEEQIFEETFKS